MATLRGFGQKTRAITRKAGRKALDADLLKAPKVVGNAIANIHIPRSNEHKLTEAMEAIVNPEESENLDTHRASLVAVLQDMSATEVDEFVNEHAELFTSLPAKDQATVDRVRKVLVKS